MPLLSRAPGPRYLQNTTGTDNKICAEACTNPSEYADKFTNQCKKCNESCFSCYGPNIFQCTSCNQPFYYNELTNECALDCPFGTFKNDSTAFYVCSACNLTCKSCDGGTGSDCLYDNFPAAPAPLLLDELLHFFGSPLCYQCSSLL